MSTLSIRSNMEQPDPYLSSIAQERLKAFANAKTDLETEQAAVQCLSLAKIIRNSIHPHIKPLNPEKALATWNLAERMFDVGRPWAQARLKADYRDADKTQLILDQIENLTLKLSDLQEQLLAGKVVYLRRAS